MTTSAPSLKPNVLTIIALCNEYCQAAETVTDNTADEFIASMTRLLPRLYITAASLYADNMGMDTDGYINNSALDEDFYNSVCMNIASVLGENDSYLEVFDEDMKYSDTPIGASIAESLADIFQVCYNFIETVKDAPSDTIESSALALADDFASYWSRKVVNVMRPLNSLQYNL